MDFVKIIATVKPLTAATITYALKGIISYPNVAIKPEIIITITFINFLRSLTIRAKNVRLFFIYVSFFSLGLNFAIYLTLAFWLKIKDMISSKRSSVFDL